MEHFGADSQEEALCRLREHVEQLRARDKEERSEYTLALSPGKLIEKDKERTYNIGYLYPRNILFSLGLRDICNQVAQRYRFQYDLSKILADLVCARIIYPGAKRSSYQDAHHFLEVPEYSLDDFYRSLLKRIMIKMVNFQ